jgi:hypothetical protein
MMHAGFECLAQHHANAAFGGFGQQQHFDFGGEAADHDGGDVVQGQLPPPFRRGADQLPVYAVQLGFGALYGDDVVGHAPVSFGFRIFRPPSIGAQARIDF